jgi:hypothetical protein
LLGRAPQEFIYLTRVWVHAQSSLVDEVSLPIGRNLSGVIQS